MKPLVVISFYDRRDPADLERLLDSLDRFDAGSAHQRVVAVNRGGGAALPARLRARVDEVLERENTGMNIGAWDGAWRRWRGHPSYLFLQDECRARRDRWLDGFLDALADPAVGMVGESFNPSWDKPWELLRAGPGKAQLRDHLVDGEPANRVDVYLHHMRRYGIDPGAGGRHLRSLVWALRGETLEALDGFPHGGNYGECIAAEIGVSRAVEALGLRLCEVGPAAFHAFSHVEWRQASPGGPYRHHPGATDLDATAQRGTAGGLAGVLAKLFGARG